MTLYVATENPGKVSEIKTLLAKQLPGIQVLSIADLDSALRKRYIAEETGSTYAENALIKARALASLVSGLVLAEDSGFEVEALGNEPGVYSARYAANDKARCEKILSELTRLAMVNRRAKFVACMALIDSSGNPSLFYGRKEGFVADSVRGTQGFGYDPIFCTEPDGATWGELGAEVKNQDSHRAKALDYVIRYLTGVKAPIAL